MNLASEKQPLASEIIADQQKEIESLKAELQDKQENLDICAGLADRYISSENCGVYDEIKR